jgi:5-methylcytosine-specific restriction endonuclease McrA
MEGIKMARIRTVKPQFIKNHDLYLAEIQTGLPLRLGFQGLWLCADREGRFKWKPMELKLDALPYDQVNMEEVMEALATHGFIIKYEYNNKFYGYIPSWKNHQVINLREAQSVLPDPELSETLTHVHARACTVQARERTLQAHELHEQVHVTPDTRKCVFDRDGYQCVRCGATEGLSIAHILTKSKGGDDSLNNLIILCFSCAYARVDNEKSFLDDLAKRANNSESRCMHVHARGEGKGREGNMEGNMEGKELKLTDVSFCHLPSQNDQSEKISKKIKRDNCPHQAIIDLYHEILPSCPAVKVWSDKRKAHLRARWMEDPKRQNLDWWRMYFTFVKFSGFLTGKRVGADGRAFFANLEFLVNSSNLIKVIEKKYHQPDELAKFKAQKEIMENSLQEPQEDSTLMVGTGVGGELFSGTLYEPANGIQTGDVGHA